MPKLPVISGKQMIRFLEGLGFTVVRQKGSHRSLQKGVYKTVFHCMTNLRREPCWVF